MKRHAYQITVHGMPLANSEGKALASKEGNYGYAVKCALSVEAIQILRDEEGMSRYCNCDKANLAVEQIKKAKRKLDQLELNEPSANAISHLEEDDVAMFDFHDYHDQQLGTSEEGRDDKFKYDDDEEVEEFLPGMNAAGYTSALPEGIPADFSYEDSANPIEGPIKKKQSFYVESIDGEIFMDKPEDEFMPIEIAGSTTRLNVAKPRGFAQGEVIVLDDD